MSRPKRKVTSASDKATLSSVKKEMAVPRLAKSARQAELALQALQGEAELTEVTGLKKKAIAAR